MGVLPTPMPKRPGHVFALVLDLVSLAAAVGFGFAYRNFLAHRLSPWILLGVMLVFAIVGGLQALLTAHAKRRLLVLLGEALAVSAFFYSADPPFLAAAGGLFFVFLAWGYVETRRELDYTTEVRFFTNTKPVMGKFITAILLFMVLLYVPQLGPGRVFVSEHTFMGFFDWSAGFVEKWYPGIPFAGSFGDFAQTLVSRELKDNSAFQALPPQSQQTTIASNAQALINNFSQSLGVAVHASDTVGGVMYDFIQKTLSGWQDRFASAFLLGWSVVVFLVLRSLGIVFMWISQLLLGGVYEILLAAGVVKIEEQTVKKEVIGY